MGAPGIPPMSLRGLAYNAPMRNRFAPVLGVVLWVAAPLALAQATVALRFQPKAGSTYKYSLVNETAAQGAPQKMKMTMSQTIKVTSVSGGKVTIETSTNNVKGEGMPASTAQDLSKIKVTNVMDVYGKVISSKATGHPMAEAMASSLGGSGFSGVEYPLKAVGVGATWKGTIDLAKMLEASGLKTTGNKMTVNYKLVKIEKQGAKTVATIEQTFSGSATAQPPAGTQGGALNLSMRGKSTITVDVADGMMLTTRGEVTTSIKSGTQFNMTSTTTTTSKRA